MDGNGPNGVVHRVVYSGKVRSELKDLGDRARQQGLGAAFLAAARRIDSELRHDPRKFGDPYYRLHIGQFTVYGRILRPLSLMYSVHDELRLVFVRSFSAYPPDAY